MPESFTGDPYYIVRDELTQTFQGAEKSYSEWKNMIKAGWVGLESSQSKNLQTKILTDLDVIEGGVSELYGVLSEIQKSNQFKHIDTTEMSMRMKFVSDMKMKVGNLRESIKKQKDKSENKQDTLRARGREDLVKEEKRGLLKGDSGTASEAEDESPPSWKINRGQQMEEIKKQDLIIDDLEHGVKRIKEHATVIKEEIDLQGHMLDEFDKDLQDAQASMDIARRGLSKFLKTADKGQLTFVLVLVAIVVLLAILVVFT